MNGSATQRLPRGFAGTVARKQDLEPAGRALRLPAQGIAEGPFLRIPDADFDAVILDAITEAMGDARSFVAWIADRLPPGGELLLDVANLQAPTMLHRVLEGRPGSFDPSGSLRHRERPVLLREILAALETAGLLVSDVFGVPSEVDELGPEFALQMFEQGFLATSCLGSTPPSRFWITARKQVALAGSVLIGAGPDADRDATEASVRAFLPHDWEIVHCSGASEAESFNDGVVRAAGDTLWFLRAGSTASREVFAALAAKAIAVPATPLAAQEPGDGLCGLMAQRQSILLTGPIALGWSSTQVAYEEFGLRLSATERNPVAVEGSFFCPASSAPVSPDTATEADRMIESWKPLLERPFRGERTPDVQRTHETVPPWQGRAPRISLCMITRNEEKFLGQCLARARDAADEIIIVDSGSTDRTVEIAESFGARVIPYVWRDDFAAARNVGLEAATGDWILVLDADEMLADGGAEEIRRCAEDAGASGFHLIMRNVYDGGQTQGVRMVRLFRNLPDVHYDNRIHEQVTPSLAAAAARDGLVLSSSDIVIEHLGYQDEVMEERNKNERNERIFRLELEAKPDDIYTLYKFGDFLRRNPEKRTECLDVLDHALEIVFDLPPHQLRGLPYAGEIAALCALEHAREGRDEHAADIVERALANMIATPNLHYIAAGLALGEGRNDEAIAHYRRCLGFADQVLVVPIQEGITGHVSITGIAHAWLQKGDHARACRLLEVSHQMCPTYEVTALSLSRLHFERGEFGKSVSVLTDFLATHPDSAGVCQQATLILNQLGLPEQARVMGGRAIALLERASLTAEAQRMRETVANLTAATRS